MMSHCLLSYSYPKGLSLTFTCITEPIFFFFAPVMLKRIGVEWMLKLTVASYAIRCVAYSALTAGHAVWVLPVELLHGVTNPLRIFLMKKREYADGVRRPRDTICVLSGSVASYLIYG